MLTKQNKELYKILINWYGETYEFYTQSYSEEVAIRNILRRLSKKFNLTNRIVMNHVLDGKDRYSVQKIKKKEESKNECK